MTKNNIGKEALERLSKAKLRLTFKCCRCGYAYPISEGFVTDLKDWKNGYSKLAIEISEFKGLDYFPIECPKCGLRHVVVIFPLPWEESKEKRR